MQTTVFRTTVVRESVGIFTHITLWISANCNNKYISGHNVLMRRLFEQYVLRACVYCAHASITLSQSTAALRPCLIYAIIRHAWLCGIISVTNFKSEHSSRNWRLVLTGSGRVDWESWRKLGEICVCKIMIDWLNRRYVTSWMSYFWASEVNHLRTRVNGENGLNMLGKKKFCTWYNVIGLC